MKRSQSCAFSEGSWSVFWIDLKPIQSKEWNSPQSGQTDQNEVFHFRCVFSYSSKRTPQFFSTITFLPCGKQQTCVSGKFPWTILSQQLFSTVHNIQKLIALIWGLPRNYILSASWLASVPRSSSLLRGYFLKSTVDNIISILGHHECEATPCLNQDSAKHQSLSQCILPYPPPPCLSTKNGVWAHMCYRCVWLCQSM